MGHKFAEIAFTESVREVQREMGSRAGYASFDSGADYNSQLSQREADFIAARDSFYMASVSETGWPYVQHRGGPVGFVRVLDARTLGFADFSGNRQYVSVGNLRRDDRVSLFFMDYLNRTRLKLLGRVRLIGDEELELLAQLESAEYRAEIERGFIIQVEAFDWNCPQHITPRYTDADVEALVQPLMQELRELKSARSASSSTGSLGHGELPLVVSGIRQLTPLVRAFELRDPDGGDLPPVDAGAHLRVPVRTADGNDVIRHYSICSNPARRDIYEIAVRLDEEGTGGSAAIHDSYTLGMQLNCELPLNNFGLQDDQSPAVLIAGGIGITPIKPMAQALRARGISFDIHYAGRDDSQMAFRDRLQHGFADKLHLYRSSLGERMNLQEILRAADEDAMIYICGPGRLIDDVLATAEALGISLTRIRFERFAATANANDRPFVVELRSSGQEIEVAADQSMLEAMLSAGAEMPYSCRSGICRSCVVEVVEGQVDHRDSVLTAQEQAQSMCPCVSRAAGDKLVVSF